jgi:ElaB/YqjD/DUF883 family membrane-anchored ribosome-binding protein
VARASEAREHLLLALSLLSGRADGAVSALRGNLASVRPEAVAHGAANLVRRRPLMTLGGVAALGIMLGAAVVAYRRARAEAEADGEFAVEEAEGVVLGEGDARSPAGVRRD